MSTGKSAKSDKFNLVSYKAGPNRVLEIKTVYARHFSQARALYGVQTQGWQSSEFMKRLERRYVKTAMGLDTNLE